MRAAARYFGVKVPMKMSAASSSTNGAPRSACSARTPNSRTSRLGSSVPGKVCTLSSPSCRSTARAGARSGRPACRSTARLRVPASSWVSAVRNALASWARG